MGLFKSIAKIAGVAIVGAATAGIGSAVMGAAMGTSVTAAGVGAAAAKGAGTAALKGAVSSGGKKGGGGGSSTPQPPTVEFKKARDVRDILRDQDPIQVAQAGGQAAFKSRNGVLDDPWKHGKEWWEDLGGNGVPDFEKYT